MEKNFPFIKIGWFDRMYDRLVLSLTRKLDDGMVFKTIIVSLLHLLSFAFLFGGIIFCVAALFGDFGYIEALDMYESGGKKALAIIGLIIGLPVGIFMSWFLYSLVRKRAQQLNGHEYGKILPFLFESTVPALIILVAEIAAALAVMAAVLKLFGTLLNTMAYAPMMKVVGFLTGNSEADAYFSGSYDYLNMSLGMETMEGATFFLVASGCALIAGYAAKDVYHYLYKLALNILSPMAYFLIAAGVGCVFMSELIFENLENLQGSAQWLPVVFVGLILVYVLKMLLKRLDKTNN